MTITIDIPADFESHAVIYKPRIIHPSPEPRYVMLLPDGPMFDGCRKNSRGNGVNASSNKPPMIMIGNDTNDDHYAWQRLCERAARWRIPLDVLLIGRPMKVACQLWTPNGRFATGHQAVNLIAVQILGDLTKSTALDTKIAETKAIFDDGE